jgi:hypothetical protein
VRVELIEEGLVGTTTMADDDGGDGEAEVDGRTKVIDVPAMTPGRGQAFHISDLMEFSTYIRRPDNYTQGDNIRHYRYPDSLNTPSLHHR